MKIRNLVFCSVLASASLLSSAAARGAQEYTGTVVPEATSTYAFITFTDIYGNYAYIARPGEIIAPPVYDMDGKVIKPGNLLLMYDLRYWQAVLDQYQANYEAARDIANVNEVNMHRFDKLSKLNAESQIASYQASYTYYTSLISMMNTKAAYDQYKIQVDKYKDWAPYEGMVVENYTTTGQTTGAYKALKVAQLNPIGVSVKMDRETAKAIGNNVPVKIYPLNSDDSQGIIYGRTVLTDDGIEFITENSPVIEGAKVIEDDSTLVIRSWAPVRKFYIDQKSDTLAVPDKSIVKDNDSYYVWRAKGQKTMQPGKSIDRYLEIEKVKIQPDNLVRVIDNFEKKVALKHKGSLEMYDLVIENPPEGLTEGQKVLYPENAYLLMPGDQVKVVIGN
ncbi:MAG TPA: hypothetical protein DD381_04675 [Lentisphaeria bacterium]|nr:MAG: hypothetical protein A2X47_11825 [Lentisphaerae bacterium GWF2_38_69]HBM15625.1 hypothetical protein [Lentisphaeria bacterium]